MAENRTLKVGLLGFGTVGQGVWKHIEQHGASLAERIGVELEIVRAVVRNPGRRREVELPAGFLTADASEVIDDPQVDLVCELMGGTDLALEYTRRVLRQGKAVITANKALLCDHGEELFAEAREHGSAIFFEASVAGGVPVIKALREGMVANRFPSIRGILNGTSNYILTRMAREGLTFEATVGAARELGYVEADEGLDLDGWDAAHKAVILAFLAHGVWVPLDSVHVEGIRRVSLDDLRFAAELGYRVKLVARVEWASREASLSTSVRPTLVAKDNLLASVDDVFNAVSLTGDVTGVMTMIGRGAGQAPTASAVISDLADAGWMLVEGIPLPTVLPAPVAGTIPFRMTGELPPSEYYLRLRVKDLPGVLASVSGKLAAEGVSVATVLQKPIVRAEGANLILTTHRCGEEALARALDLFGRDDLLLEEPLCCPILNGEDA